MQIDPAVCMFSWLQTNRLTDKQSIYIYIPGYIMALSFYLLVKLLIVAQSFSIFGFTIFSWIFKILQKFENF